MRSVSNDQCDVGRELLRFQESSGHDVGAKGSRAKRFVSLMEATGVGASCGGSRWHTVASAFKGQLRALKVL